MPNMPSGRPRKSTEYVTGPAPDLDIVADQKQAQSDPEDPNGYEERPCDGD